MRSKNTLLPLAMVVAVGLSGASASATSIAARHDVGKITVKAQGVRKD